MTVLIHYHDYQRSVAAVYICRHDQRRLKSKPNNFFTASIRISNRFCAEEVQYRYIMPSASPSSPSNYCYFMIPLTFRSEPSSAQSASLDSSLEYRDAYA
eukprot:scpid102948/ scgid19184/ 